MPTAPTIPPSLAARPFRGSCAVDLGLLTARQLQGTAWRRVFRDVYVRSTVKDTPLVRARAARLLLPDGAALTGRTAAWLYGAHAGDETGPVEVLTPHRFGPITGLRIHTGELSRADLRTRGEFTLTTPLRTAWELGRRRPLLDAVMWIDALARQTRLSRAEMTAYAQERPHMRCGRAALRAMRLADGRAESPPESHVRVTLLLAGLPPAVPQFDVYDDGYFIARLDLAWPWAKLGLEYDGIGHATYDQLARDRRRANELAAAGWHIYAMTAQDLGSLSVIAQQIAALLATRQNR